MTTKFSWSVFFTCAIKCLLETSEWTASLAAPWRGEGRGQSEHSHLQGEGESQTRTVSDSAELHKRIWVAKDGTIFLKSLSSHSKGICKLYSSKRFLKYTLCPLRADLLKYLFWHEEVLRDVVLTWLLMQLNLKQVHSECQKIRHIFVWHIWQGQILLIELNEIYKGYVLHCIMMLVVTYWW